jgi:hypothetical protein
MAKSNRERQAEFKERMRVEGKQQLTVWVTPKQAKVIKDFLAAAVRLPSEPRTQEKKGHR